MSPFEPMPEHDPAPAPAYDDAQWVAILTAIDPAGLGGVALRAWSSPQRDLFLHHLRLLLPSAAPFRKMPLNIADERLFGGLDLTATLAASKPVMAQGMLADAAGGAILIAMAERLDRGRAARIANIMDQQPCPAMILLDEGLEDDEAPPAALADRLAFSLSGHALPAGGVLWPDQLDIAAATECLPAVALSDAGLDRLCRLASMFGIYSLRPSILAARAAHARAAFDGRLEVDETDIDLAVRLVLVPRATIIPASEPVSDEPDQPDQPEDQPTDTTAPNEQIQELEETVTDATQSLLPPELLAALAASHRQRRTPRGAGQAGESMSKLRGRPAGSRPGALGGGARLALLDTLRAAAPWQRLRARPDQPERRGKIAVRADDFRILRFKERARTVAIFSVDASGSAALNRLAEAKGAIQLLLADCYVRRDQVALVAFRGRAAECLLPPTHALARARRSLASLPGGGPTPLALGIDEARLLADAERRRGHLPLLVLLTDGGANIGRDGKPGRAAAAADALAAARQCKVAGFRALVVDTAPRPNPFVAKLAAEMGARYLPLPYADAQSLSRAVQNQDFINVRSAA
ncbi:MAG: hypothetical protein B7Z78_01275 [Rhodospirillales bacterium 20-60-12]|nr:MAG: hypothetical protein B7Z78_01275 [Rhodospirillales bacterium 20-60-12]HQT66896.1 magnesium chelatase subunit D [Acetobacteraceae bacterium]